MVHVPAEHADAAVVLPRLADHRAESGPIHLVVAVGMPGTGDSGKIGIVEFRRHADLLGDVFLQLDLVNGLGPDLAVRLNDMALIALGRPRRHPHVRPGEIERIRLGLGPEVLQNALRRRLRPHVKPAHCQAQSQTNHQ